MHEKKYKIVIDTGVWISGLFGGFSQKWLNEILANKNITVFVCDELIDEFKNSAANAKITKYVSSKIIKAFLIVVQNKTKKLKLSSTVKISRDLNDDYLLALSKDSYSDYLLTYDKDLLVLEVYKKTKIIDIKDFMKILKD